MYRTKRIAVGRWAFVGVMSEGQAELATTRSISVHVVAGLARRGHRDDGAVGLDGPAHANRSVHRTGQDPTDGLLSRVSEGTEGREVLQRLPVLNHEGNTLNALANAPSELFSSPSTELASRKQAFVGDAFRIRGGFKVAYRWKRKRVGAVWIVGGAEVVKPNETVGIGNL